MISCLLLVISRHHNYYVHKLLIYTTGSYDSALASVEPTVFKVKKVEEEKPALIPYEVHEEEEEEVKDSGEEQLSSGQNPNGANSEDQESSSKSGGFPNLVGFIPPTPDQKKIIDCDEKDEKNAEEEKQEEESEGRRLEREEDEREMKRREEEEKKRIEENNKLRDKLAAKARDKMVQVCFSGYIFCLAIIFCNHRQQKKKLFSWREKERQRHSWLFLPKRKPQ